MARVTPQLIVELIRTFPRPQQEQVERDLTGLLRPPYHDLNVQLQCQALPVPIGMLEYALRFGTPASVVLLLEAGADPDAGTVRPMTVLCMTACPDEGRIEKLEAMLRFGAKANYFETGPLVPPTPLIALARSKATGIQRYWIARLLRAAGATAQTVNDYELRVVGRLLGEFRALDSIMECLGPDQHTATKETPSSFAGLTAAVLRSGDPTALERMMRVNAELHLGMDFDPTPPLLQLAMRIADNPVTLAQADFAWLLIDAGAVLQAAPGHDTPFERALANENHELMDIFLEAGAKPELASSAEMVAELMRRQGLPQRPKARQPDQPAAEPGKALTALDLLCSGMEGLEACPDSELGRLGASRGAVLQTLAERLHAIANKLSSAPPRLRAN
jgi:hypothetical protein